MVDVKSIVSIRSFPEHYCEMNNNIKSIVLPGPNSVIVITVITGIQSTHFEKARLLLSSFILGSFCWINKQIMEILNFTHNSSDIFNNISDNNYSGSDDVTEEEGEDPAWVLHMDRAKMVMTVIGFIANIGTTITLMVNGQVCNHFDEFRNI